MTRRPRVLLAVQVVLVAAILGGVVSLAALHPRRLDLTAGRRFTLSPHTRTVLDQLDVPVQITAFYASQADGARRELADLLALYRDASRRIRFRLLDLDRNPGEATRLEVTAYGTAVVEAGPRRAQIAHVTEDSVTASLISVTGSTPVVTYFVVGHGERDPRAADERGSLARAARALVREGFAVDVVEGAAELPDDVDLVVLAGPSRDLAPAETRALGSHVTGGGSLLVLADVDAPPTLQGFLDEFGVELSGDLVVDTGGRLLGTDGLSARVAHLNEHLVRDTPLARALLPLAQTVRIVDVPGVRADYLAITAEDAWADVARRGLGGEEPIFRPGQDRPGPLPVAVFARVGESGRLVVIGDADFATDLHLDVLGNQSLLLAAAGLVGRDDASAATRPVAAPAPPFSPLALTTREARLLLWGGAIGPAALLAAIGGLLARRRRYA